MQYQEYHIKDHWGLKFLCYVQNVLRGSEGPRLAHDVNSKPRAGLPVIHLHVHEIHIFSWLRFGIGTTQGKRISIGLHCFIVQLIRRERL